MPAIIANLTGGHLEPTPHAAENLRAAAGEEPTGVYTVFRTYRRNQAVRLDAHFRRLEESAGLEGVQIELDREHIRAALRQLIDLAGYPESRLRMTIPFDRPQEPVLAIEPLQSVSANLRANGVKAATVQLTRRNPRAKSNTWEAVRAKALHQLSDDVYEGLLVDEGGQILEGFTSNIYAVQGQDLQTPEAGILHGVSRQILLDVLPSDLHLVHRPIRLESLAAINEFFLTSSSRGVVPIIQIDDHIIGDGKPGPWTLRLDHRYRQWVEDHLEPI
ncbi:MAG: aminotransferase class IV [Anaerolineales bacterium]